MHSEKHSLPHFHFWCICGKFIAPVIYSKISTTSSDLFRAVILVRFIVCQCTVRAGMGSVQYWKRVVAASCMSTILIDWLDVIHRAIKIICRSTLSRLHSVYLPSCTTALHNQSVYKSTWIIHIQELLSDKIALSSVTQHYMYIHDAIIERLATLF